MEIQTKFKQVLDCMDDLMQLLADANFEKQSKEIDMQYYKIERIKFEVLKNGTEKK